MHDSDDDRPLLSSSARLAALTLLGLLLLIAFASRFVITGYIVARLLAPALLALASALGALAAGAFLRRALAKRLGGESPESRLAFDFLVGYPIYGTMIYVVSLVSISRPLSAVILLAGVAAGALTLRNYSRNNEQSGIEPAPATIFALTLLAIAATLSFVSAQLPAFTLDELAYHLAVPRMWATEGRVVELPLLSHSYFPFGIESADIPLLSILGANGAIASHLLHLLAAIAAARLGHSWLRGHVDQGPALIGTLAVITTPALLVTAGWSWNDWPVAGLTVAMLIALDREPPDLPAAAAVLAAGLLTKYTFVVIALAFAIAAWVAMRDRRRALIIAFVHGSLLGSFFFWRNLVQSGNPVAPFLEAAAPTVSGIRRSASVPETLGDYIFNGRYLDEALGVTILIGIAGAVLVRGMFLKLIVICFALATIAMLFLAPSSRILVPLLIPPALAGLVAAERVAQDARGWRTTWRVLILAAASCQVLLVGYHANLSHPTDVLFGRVTDAEYVNRERQDATAIGMLDARLPSGSRTLVAGTQELFWFSHRVRGGGNADGPRINRFLEGGIAERLHHERITHVAILSRGLVFEHAAGDRRLEERRTILTLEAAANLRTFLAANARIVERSEEFELYEVGVEVR